MKRREFLRQAGRVVGVFATAPLLVGTDASTEGGRLTASGSIDWSIDPQEYLSPRIITLLNRCHSSLGLEVSERELVQFMATVHREAEEIAAERRLALKLRGVS